MKEVPDFVWIVCCLEDSFAYFLFGFDGLIVPPLQDVSIAIGTNLRIEVMAVYFVRLSSAALFAAAPARIDVFLKCDSVNVSGTVTFQASGLPRDHGIRVAPSGRFPFVLVKPTGSVATGI